MIGYVFGKAVNILKRKPFMLWGVSLLASVITIAVKLTGWLVPIITIPITLTLTAGMSALYLDGYNGKEVNSKQLFRGFSKECISRVPAGMLWHKLWSTVWAFVPIAGIVKAYSYAFTPYILLTRPDVSVLDALKLSMQKTQGYRLRMFGADLLMLLIFIGLYLLFALVMIVPVLGWIVGFVGIVATVILFPLFTGLVKAGFYEEAQSGRFRQSYYYQAQTQNNAPNAADNTAFNADNSNPSNADFAQNVNNAWFCTQCGTANAVSSNFCTKCGNRHNV